MSLPRDFTSCFSFLAPLLCHVHSGVRCHCQVKNLFVCSQADTGSFRLSSLWEVIRSLEMLFPGQSDCVRIDLAVLIMLNGNDYLPKVRGVSFDRCFRSYTKLKHGKHK